MNTIRFRVIQRLDLFFGIFLIWAVGFIVIWHMSGRCRFPLGNPCEGRGKEGGRRSEVAVVPHIPVYVVEEHHEVLLYWYDAARRGLIKREGNVLLHIDGHSDGGTPEVRSDLPWFRFPRPRDVFKMMQKNDVFVVAAGFNGLLKRYIWVWPPWDEAEDDSSSHIVFGVKLGTTIRENIEGLMIEDFCACFTEKAQTTLVYPEENCMMPNLTSHSAEVIEIDPRDCHIRITDAIVEIVSEDKAIELMKTGNWITSLDSVILDVDEDYYGCEAAVQPLYDANVMEDKLSWITYYISKLFCPTLPEHETKADKFFARLVDTVVNLKRFCVRSVNDTKACKNTSTLRQHLLNLTDSLIEDLLERQLKPTFCRSDKITKLILKKLLGEFFLFSQKQLTTIKDVGICVTEALRSSFYTPEAGMKICDGYNKPIMSVVPFRTPSLDEVTFRTNQLKVMLGTGAFTPSIVSVCRSVRDGYTPRKLFHRIERDVLYTLQHSFRGVDVESIFYDPYLLGGQQGWYGRH